MRPPINNPTSAPSVVEPAEGVAGGSHQRMVGLPSRIAYAAESKFCAECGLAATGEMRHALAAAMHHGQLVTLQSIARQSNDQAQRPRTRGLAIAPDVLERSEDVARGSSGARG